MWREEEGVRGRGRVYTDGGGYRRLREGICGSMFGNCSMFSVC